MEKTTNHMNQPRPNKLTAKKIALIHELLDPDAEAKDIRALADLLELSYSTVWHLVRGYCRHDDAPWAEWGADIPLEE